MRWGAGQQGTRRVIVTGRSRQGSKIDGGEQLEAGNDQWGGMIGNDWSRRRVSKGQGRRQMGSTGGQGW